VRIVCVHTRNNARPGCRRGGTTDDVEEIRPAEVSVLLVFFFLFFFPTRSECERFSSHAVGGRDLSREPCARTPGKICINGLQFDVRWMLIDRRELSFNTVHDRRHRVAADHARIQRLSRRPLIGTGRYHHFFSPRLWPTYKNVKKHLRRFVNPWTDDTGK